MLYLDYSGQINNYRKGMGISNLSGKALSSIIHPLPPSAEQKRIAAKLEELMAFCDGLEQSIKESQGNNEMLLQQVLREALEPK
jgi:type I restriction enzyme S subunit